jgi:hypothetical protein
MVHPAPEERMPFSCRIEEKRPGYRRITSRANLFIFRYQQDVFIRKVAWNVETNFRGIFES